MSQFNKKKYNNFIVESRKERVKQRNQSAIERKMQQLSTKRDDQALVHHDTSDQKTENPQEDTAKRTQAPNRRNKKYKTLDEE